MSVPYHALVIMLLFPCIIYCQMMNELIPLMAEKPIADTSSPSNEGLRVSQKERKILHHGTMKHFKIHRLLSTSQQATAQAFHHMTNYTCKIVTQQQKRSSSN